MSTRKTAQPHDSREEPEYYVDPLDDWIADQHGQWAEQYAGMCVAIVEWR
jgi:hypothetical protein